MLCIGIQESTDHSLVLGMAFLGLRLKKVHTPLAQRDRDLDAFITKDKIPGGRQEIRDDFEIPEGLVGVFYFRAHKSTCLSASIRRR